VYHLALETFNLRDHLSSISPLTDEAWDAFDQLTEQTELSKNKWLLREGERAYFAYLLIGGIIRVYFSKDGAEYNKTFFIPGTFPTPLTALLEQKPSQLNFQALTDCRLIRFSYADFRTLFREHRCLESLMLAVLEREWIQKEKHDIRMVTNDAGTNYAIFLKEYPGLEQQIPQYHIASYLGITPIQLSRIRAQRTVHS
jgi:CRP-like cAMP-binding protein